VEIKNIHIGNIIKELWKEREVTLERACNFFQCEEEEITAMLNSKSIEADRLLKWCKLLEYDFFRIYSQHLILFSPKSIRKYKGKRKTSKSSKAPVFKKNVYTKEIIDYLLGLIREEKKTPQQIIEEYRIPKTTLYRWIQKYN